MRKLLTIVLAIGLIFAFTLPANAAWKDMWAYVYTWDGGMNSDGTMKLTRQTTNITFLVLEKDYVDTLEKLYVFGDDRMVTTGMGHADQLGAVRSAITGTNFASATVCNGMVRFRVDPTETNDRYVDLMVVDQDGGFMTYVEDFDEYTHTIIIDERPNVWHHGAIWYYASTGAAALLTGIEINRNTIIRTMAIEVITLDDGETIDVGLTAGGTNGDADGFIDGGLVATVGYWDVKRHMDPAVASPDGVHGISSGATHFHYTSENPLGALLGTTIPGSGGDTLVGYHGFVEHWDFWIHATQEQSLEWNISACSTAWGFIHYYFMQIR